MTVILDKTKYSNIYRSLNREFYVYRRKNASMSEIIHGDHPRVFEKWINETHNLKLIFGNESGSPNGVIKHVYWIEFDSEEEKTLFLLSWNA